jgi:cell division protein FtsB
MRLSLRKIGLATAILLAAGYAFVTLLGPQGMPALAEKQRQIRQLETTNEVLAREIELRRERIERLRESPSLQELEIRQRLKLVQPDERVYILQDGKKK